VNTYRRSVTAKLGHKVGVLGSERDENMGMLGTVVAVTLTVTVIGCVCVCVGVFCFVPYNLS